MTLITFQTYRWFNCKQFFLMQLFLNAGTYTALTELEIYVVGTVNQSHSKPPNWEMTLPNLVSLFLTSLRLLFRLIRHSAICDVSSHL